MLTEEVKKMCTDRIIPDEARLLAGTDHPSSEGRELFAPETLDFLDELSRALRRHSADPETAAFAFWCRRAHLRALRKKHGVSDPEEIQGTGSGPLRLGRGLLFHLAPANVPMMFAYSWVIGMLAGNAGIVRISERTLRLENVRAVLDTIRMLFDRPEYTEVRSRSSFITYDRSDDVTESILASGRVHV